MNAKTLFAALTIFTATGSAFAAGSTEWADFSDFVSTKSRADVIAELKQAQTEGSYLVGGESFANQAIAAAPMARPMTLAAAMPSSGKTRAEVIAELKQAQAEGSYVVGGREFVDSNMPVAKRAGEAIDVAQAK